MGEAYRDIAKHFAQVSALAAATWGLKKLISRGGDNGEQQLDLCGGLLEIADYEDCVSAKSANKVGLGDKHVYSNCQCTDHEVAGLPKLQRSQSHRLIPHPESQFQAATPDWIQEYKEPQDEHFPQPEHVLEAVVGGHIPCTVL